MSAAARVSLAPDRHAPAAGMNGTAPEPLLFRGGARVILGTVPGSPTMPIVPAAGTLFGPRGACLAAADGPLFVCDTGHHRVLVWNDRPDRDGAPADLVLGQSDFVTEGRNSGGEVTAATLNVPTGIAFGAGVLAVADAWNHRVLLWHGVPRSNAQPAEIVLGQADFSRNLANRGHSAPGADTLSWCYGVTIADGRLIVADTGNRRLLVWDKVPERNGAPADLVLGQTDFAARDDGGGAAPGPAGMRWPHGILVSNGGLCVADSGANRIMVWTQFPTTNGAPCDFVLGQDDPSGIDHNRGVWAPTAASMNMPYAIARLGGRLVVADTANSRLIGFTAESLAMGVPGDTLSGQGGFALRGDNRWREPGRDSVSWPYGICCCDTLAVVADSGNDRVLLWESA
jgi:hypothetical protein